MKYLLVRRIATYLAGVVILAAPLALRAESHSKVIDIVVVESRDLAEEAQFPGDSLFLHSDSAGSTYLYIEQSNGTRLSVFDVSDPAKIKLVSSTPLADGGPFDFVRSLSGRAELIRYRAGNRVAVVDLKKPRRPIVQMVSTPISSGTDGALGRTGFVTVGQSYGYVPASARDYQIIDASNPVNPVLLGTVKGVEHSVVNSDTGTSFLLGRSGLTVVRQISTENEAKTE
jgi:hypothetical protein